MVISRDRAPSPAGTSNPARAGDGYLLALDAGTGSCRAALFTLDGLSPGGQPAALARREWSHPPASGIPGSQSFDPAGNWALICACIREVLGSLPSPAAVLAVGCSTMGGGLVLYDRAGQELWACANGDARAEREAAVMLADGTAAELYRRGGGWISLSAAPRLAWVRRHEPGLWAAATRLSMIADWIVFRLTGTLATEASIGSTSGLFDLGRRAWSPELLNRCGLEPGLFPEVVEAGTVVGQVSAAASRQTGLAPGTPVVAGGLDTALGLTGPRPALPGRLTVTGGSFWKQTVVAPAPAVDPAGRLRTICHVWPGQWLVEGISFYAGFALRWLRDRAAAGRPGGRAPRYAELEELAAAVPPGAGGLTARLVPADAWAWARWQPPFPPRPATASPGWAAGAGRAGAGHPGGRRLLHPPGGRADQRAPRSRRRDRGHPDRRGSPQHAVAADPRRRAREPGRRARAHRVGGPRSGDPRRPRGGDAAGRPTARPTSPAHGPARGRTTPGLPSRPGPGHAPQPGQAAGL